MKILVIHGPNLNLLGSRAPEIYGTKSLDEINRSIEDFARKKKLSVVFFQSNIEGEIIDRIHRAGARETPDSTDAIVINPGAYTHYSIAIRDAIQAVSIPTVEVHLSNIYAREPVRHNSVVAPVCIGQISGLGYVGYLLAIEALASDLRMK